MGLSIISKILLTSHRKCSHHMFVDQYIIFTQSHHKHSHRMSVDQLTSRCEYSPHMFVDQGLIFTDKSCEPLNISL